MNALQAALQDTLHEAGDPGPVTEFRPVGGGDINQAGKLTTTSGEYFVKWHTNPPPQMLEVEGRGLALLTASDTARIPGVIGQGRVPGSKTEFLILEWIERNNIYTRTTGQPLTIRGVWGLETAGSGATARMVAYRRDPTVVKLHMPMPFRFLPAYQDGPMLFKVPGIFRLGGVDVRPPKSMRYVDGI